jgi:hypothetical protein
MSVTIRGGEQLLALCDAMDASPLPVIRTETIRRLLADEDRDDTYRRADGTEDAAWMQPHHDFVMSLPLSDQQRAELLRHFDEVYSTAVEEGAYQSVLDRRLLSVIFRAADRRRQASQAGAAGPQGPPDSGPAVAPTP